MKAFFKQDSSGFTIVELLVVIVIIGILAAITIVSYTGISDKAKIASLQSDLTSASTKLKLYQTDNGYFPTTLTLSSGIYCPSPADSIYCVKTSSGNVLAYSPGDGSSPQTYVLTATNNTTNYTITNNSQPIATAPNSPVADWLATPQGDHYGNYYDLVGKQWATVTRAGTKTIYDPNTQHMYDVPANFIGVNPRTDGKSGSEAVIESSGTNYIQNSDFETDLSGWTAALGTMTQDSSKSVHGNTSLKFTASAVNGRPDYYISLTGSQSYTFSAYLWIPSGYNSLQLEAYDSGNSTAYDVNLTGSSSWKRYSTTFTTSSGTPTVYLRIVDRASSGWQSFYLDAPQVEAGGFSTSYIPTTTVSASRNADMVTIPTTGWNKSNGTELAVAESPNDATVQPYAFITDWEAPSGSDSEIDLRDNNLEVWQNPINSTATHVRQTLGTTHVFGMTWATGSPAIHYLDASGTASGVNCPALSTMAAVAGLGMQNLYGGNNFYNALIQRVVIYSSTLSGANVTSVTNSIKDGP